MADTVKKGERDDKKPKSVNHNNTLGFSVSGAPLWLCKVLSQEAKQSYNNVYWVVLVEWYKKAKQLDAIIGNSSITSSGIVEEEVKENVVPLFGDNKGVKNEVKEDGKI